MKVLKTVWILLLFLIVSCKKESPSPDLGKLTKDIERIIQPMITDHKTVGAAVGIIKNGQKQQFFFGEKEKGRGENVDEHTLFEIGSIDKTMTATLLADMVLSGKLRLDYYIRDYLPEVNNFPEYKGQQITFLNLANHTSSLPEWPDYYGYSGNEKIIPCDQECVDSMYTFLNNYQLTSPINSKWVYGNFAYGLLGHTLGKIKGVCIETLFQEEIWDKLGMDNTYSIVPEGYDNVAQPHFRDDLSTAPFWDFDACLRGTSGSKSTLKDMIKYLEANMGLANSAIYPAMKYAQQPATSIVPYLETCLAWRRARFNESKGTHIVFKTGGTIGSTAIIAFVPEENLGVMLLFNANVRGKIYHGNLTEEIYRAVKILEALEKY